MPVNSNMLELIYSNAEITRYAWCSVVILNEDYAILALVLAKSLKLVGKTNQNIVLVVDDIIINGKYFELLKQHYTHIYRTTYIYKDCKIFYDKFKTMYSSWINYSFTKWEILSLYSYDKVVFVDADSICARPNVDKLLSTNTPAAIWDSDWNNIKYPDVMTASDMMKMFYTGKNNSKPVKPCNMVAAGLVFLTPDVKMYNFMISYLDSCKSFGFKNNKSGMDEQLLVYIYAKNGMPFYNISKKTMCVKWKDKTNSNEFIQLFGMDKLKNIYLQEFSDTKIWMMINNTIDGLPPIPDNTISCPWCNSTDHTYFDEDFNVLCDQYNDEYIKPLKRIKFSI